MAESLCIAQDSKMMRMKTRRNEVPHMSGGSSAAAADNELELRPGGMLVQKRTDADQNLVPPPMIRVYVKYGSINHQIHISSEASFGELKKRLTGPTGLHHQDQKLYYKDKERDSKAFLDTTGVKDKSKLVLVEDTIGKEKRYLEVKKNAKIEKDKKLISEISLEVDRLARQVSSLESIISRGGKVVEKDVLNLIELLMNQLLKLEGVIGDDDVKLQRKMQAKRVQKYVETLDMLKIKNSMTTSTQQKVYSSGLVSSPPIHQTRHLKPSISTPVPLQQTKHSLIGSLKQPSSHLVSEPVVITMQWETFDSTSSKIPGAPSASTINPAQPSFIRDLI
ncbi:BAG family molecular chaperone regulator 1-like [Olea europaea subsp. europaea]|uniref:BAG family molecular chaperone regulator 1-like n=2 Tax=Olea europaea subsp. europaea TaxID=158383 RepID=A0A8S0RQR0_OLEEU|nr:BAG family molecular chaperone regulator 1-like [Olea europaea subsp. europaea]